MTRAAVIALVVLCGFADPSRAAAQQALIIVRHAERETGEGDDGLSAAGQARAERLAAMMRDARISHVFVSDRRRTGDTARPIARALGLTPTVVPIPAKADGDPADAQVKATLDAAAAHPRGVALIVGHSNTVPLFLKRLGHPAAVTIADTEFDNLFVVVRMPSGPPVVTQLRY